MIQSVFGHMGIVTCVDFSPESGLHGNQGDGLIGTGSHDASVLLWRWSAKLNRVVGVIPDNQGMTFYTRLAYPIWKHGSCADT